MSRRSYARALCVAVVLTGHGEPRADGLFHVWVPTFEAATGAEARPEVCAMPGMPALLDTRQPIELIDAGDRVLIRYAEWRVTRVVYVDPRSRPARQDPSAMGVSFGRFSGDTLEIFTLYIDYPYRDRVGTPQGEAVTVLERYTPNADSTRLDFEMTVTDEQTMVEPVEWAGHMTVATSQVLEPADDCGLAD